MATPKTGVADTESRRFASNLDKLIQLVGFSRKEAAEAIGVPYKLIRRYVSAGIGRPDYRSQDSLKKVAAYFGVQNVRSLWREDLIESLLTTEDGRHFVTKFRTQLTQRWQEERSKKADADEQRLEWLDIALGNTIRLKPSRPPLSHLEKARAILDVDTPTSAAFRVVVDVFHNALELKQTG